MKDNVEVQEVKTCKECPFSHWSDNLFGYGQNGSYCALSDIKHRFNVNDKSWIRTVHKDCPLRKKPHVKITAIHGVEYATKGDN